MARPKKENPRVRRQITLAPETDEILRKMSEETYIPMSNLLDRMIIEYDKKRKEERNNADGN